MTKRHLRPAPATTGRNSACGVRRLAGVLLFGFIVAATAMAGEQATVFTLTDALGEKKPLKLHLLTHDREFVAGFVTGYNARSHAVDSSGLRCEGTNLAGHVGVTLAPDFYTPADGKTVECAFQFSGGTFTGRCGDRAVAGGVSSAVVTQPDAAAFARCRLRILGALRRLQQTKGVNWQYALDMNLTFPWPATLAQLETIVPDYRRYSAVVTKCAVARDGHRLRGTVVALVDYGGQGGRLPERKEPHTFTVDCVVIGDTVGGTCEIRVGDIVVNERVLGAMNTMPAPAPAQSAVVMRLHDATQGDGPVVLQLSLSDTRLIHGLAWVPSENHQPHTVDASGLKLDGDKLVGPVRVTVVPDVYRKGEPFDIVCVLDVRVQGYEVAGAFTGTDRGEKRQGAVTGELRPKEAPLVDNVRELTAVEVGLGYCLVGGPPPHVKDPAAASQATVLLEYRDSHVTKATVINPATRQPLPATETRGDLQIDGDRLTGEVAFRLGTGRYVFRLTATINGAAFGGYWRGTFDGAPVLTKSSKLGGRLSTMTGKAGAGQT